MLKPKPISFRPSQANKTLLTELAKLAKRDNRNLNNYIETILLKHVTDNTKPKKA